MRNRRLPLFPVLLVAFCLLYAMPAGTHDQEHDAPDLPEATRLLIDDVRGSTVRFQDVAVALDEGYGKFLDCFKHGADQGMGQHYVNGELVGDDALDPLQPEALVYEPRKDGTMILVAFEYLVFADVWDANDEGREPPTLFGQEFQLKTNIPETPPVWALHIWLWAHNPEGLFADYNPIIFCPEDQPSIDMSMS